MTNRIINLIFCIVFVVIGILNIVLVHLVPGIFYIFLSLLYFPPVDTFFKKKFNLTVPFVIKIAVAVIVFWGTLAISDLADILGL